MKVHARITIIYSFFFKYNKTNVYTSETPTLNLYCTIVYYTLRNKGTKAVTVAVPFLKEHFCTY